jgi:chromosome segregation protein
VRATRPSVATLLDRLLAGVVLCRGDLRAALDLASALPAEAVVVTLDGDRFSARGWRLGAGRAGATRAALEVVRLESVIAETGAADARQSAEAARQAHTLARTAARDLGRRFEAAAAEERQAKTQRSEAARRLQLLREQAPAVGTSRSESGRVVADLSTRLAECEAALVAAEQFEREIVEVSEAAAEIRRELDLKAQGLSRRRTDLEVRASAVAQRQRMLEARRRDIDNRLAGYDDARSKATARREGYETSAKALERLSKSVDDVVRQLSGILAVLTERRQQHDASVRAIMARLTSARASRSEAERDLGSTRERAQRVELDRAELRVRLESAVEALRHDLETEPAEAMAAQCPELPPGTPPVARVRELERELRLLGPINPLALEELGALEERDRFLSGQLEDVKEARRELTRVIRAVDAEIVSVFAEAFADVARHFETLFTTLFPGGSGQLTLIDPDDLLNTGVEIEARPAGRNVRRLSLLSGGERSLVALAYLFAVFRSRPSPFYLMDEVEAALDDINLHRFLDLVDEFRSEAQLLIVSHQKRTMESADNLYGVTLQPGGASKVVSERLRSSEARTG